MTSSVVSQGRRSFVAPPLGYTRERLCRSQVGLPVSPPPAATCYHGACHRPGHLLASARDVMEGSLQLRPKLIALTVPMAVVVGCACAFFLWSLEAVTRVRFDHPWLL